MKQVYKEHRFTRYSEKLIAICEAIMAKGIAAGYIYTVRQLYYQLVQSNTIANNERSYKNICRLMDDARNAGLIDWDWIEDRTRALRTKSHWGSGKEILEGAARGFDMDMWENQSKRVFVIVEKDALVNVVERPCLKLDVPYLAARGYPSCSAVREMVVSSMIPAYTNEQEIVVIHLGDHDPSGIDMSRDLENRIELYGRGFEFKFHRIALNMDQIEELKPAPNPTKFSDSRATAYRQLYGDSSWELDALPLAYLDDLIESNIRKHLDEAKWADRVLAIKATKKRLERYARNFNKFKG